MDAALRTPLTTRRVGENARERREEKSSTIRTAINVTKCFVGAASFELPWAFAQAGVAGSIIGILILAALSLFSLNRLSICSVLVSSRDGRALTYPEIGRQAFGRAGYLISWFGVVAMSLGVCGSYLVFISSTLVELTGWPKTVNANKTVSSADASMWVLGLLPIIVVLSWLRNVTTLAWTSSVGIMALVTAVLVSSYDAYENGQSTDIDFSEWSHEETGTMGALRLSTYPLFLGNAGYLYLISTAILPVTQSMERPKQFSTALTPSVIFVTVLNLVFGLYASVRYGGSVCESDDDRIGSHLGCVKDNVLKNMDPTSVLTKVVKWGLAIDLLFTTIVFLFPLTEAMDRALFGEETEVIDRNDDDNNTGIDEEAQQYYSQCLATASKASDRHWMFNTRMWKGNALRAFVVVAVAGVALGVPFFSLLTGLTGGFGNNILGFILPPVFYYRLRGKEYWFKSDGTRRHLLEFAGLVVTFLFGLIFLVLTLVFFGREIANEES